jgi:hypothetical protein
MTFFFFQELISISKMTLVVAICETCPPTEVDGMINVLLNLFDTRASLMKLIKIMIDREVANTGALKSQLLFLSS